MAHRKTHGVATVRLRPSPNAAGSEASGPARPAVCAEVVTSATEASAMATNRLPSSAFAPCGYCGGAVVFALSAPDGDRSSSPAWAHVECLVCGGLSLVCALAPEADESAGGERGAPGLDPDYYTVRQRLPRPVGRIVRALRRLRTRALLGLHPGWLARRFSGRRYGHFDWFRRTGTHLGDPILDVGCGSGRLLFHLHADGFRDLVGLDPNLPAAAIERAAALPGLRLERGALETHRGRYALVMAHHSFEHMADPRARFAELAALVAPGGWLLLRVPLADSWARGQYGAAWAQLDPPHHRHIPTRASIARLAAEAGLALDHVEDDSGVFQILGSERDPPAGTRARFVRWLSARRQAARLRRAGRGDQAAFYLRRLT